MVATLLEKRRHHLPIGELPVNNLSLLEFSQDNGLIKEIEKTGNQWIIGIYTNRLNAWKDTWKSSRFGEGKNQTADARLRTKDDILLTEGIVVSTPTLANISDAQIIFSGLNGPMNSKIDGGGKTLFLPCSQEIIIEDIVNRKEIKRISNPLFNDLHSVDLNSKKNSALVVSSGADKIVEIDIKTGKVIWEWDADEFAERNGLVKPGTMEKRQALHDVDDFRKWLVPTPAQVTHVNTATWLNEKQIGITLFHQGLALVVDRDTNETNIVRNGLTKPHGFQPTNDGNFVITNTGGGEILVLDQNFRTKEIISGFFDSHPKDEISWLHTSFPVDGKIIAVDQTLTQLILLDTKGKRLCRIKHPENWKVSYVARI